MRQCPYQGGSAKRNPPDGKPLRPDWGILPQPPVGMRSHHAFSHREKVAEGRMRAIRGGVITALAISGARLNAGETRKADVLIRRTATALIRRYAAPSPGGRRRDASATVL